MAKYTVMNKRYRAYLSAGWWVTREGQHLHMSNISDPDLVNIYRMLARVAKKRVDDTITAYMADPSPQGEMAQDAFDREMDAAMEMNYYDVLSCHPAFDKLCEHLSSRGLLHFADKGFNAVTQGDIDYYLTSRETNI